MILADKIAYLRKKNGWSQEELADKMQVSRQAVSKWEGAQTVPDLDKILALSRLFGVTTDYLLKDEIESEEFSDDTERAPVKRISLALANEFLEWRKQAAKYIAAATLMCVVAAIPLILLAAATETLPENFAAGLGLIILLMLVAAAVAIFVYCGLKNAPYEFIDKEPFETEYGVNGMVKERQREYRSAYAKINTVAASLCVLSPIPLFGSLVAGDEFFTVAMLAVMMLLAGIGAALFVLAGVRWASMQKLLKEVDYAQRDQKKQRAKEALSSLYWLSATAIFLGWSFLTNDWDITWVVWVIAGTLFPAVMRIFILITDRDVKNQDK